MIFLNVLIRNIVVAVFSCREMASLVERLRVRSDCKPVYTSGGSDFDSDDFVPKKNQTAEQAEGGIVVSEPGCLCLIVQTFTVFKLHSGRDMKIVFAAAYQKVQK